LKSFPTARPSPAPPQPSLHTPPPQFSWDTNTFTRTLRSAMLGSTLPRLPHLHRVDTYTLAETTPPRKLRTRRPPSRARLLQCAHKHRVEALQSACPAARRRRACGLAARVMCRPWLLRSDASSTRSAARCPRCRQTCHRCGENSLHERTRATSWPRLNGIPWDGGTFPLPHLEPLPASWAAHHPVATLASHSSSLIDVG